MPEDYASKMPAGFASKAPYPEIKVIKQNKMYADLLMDDNSGEVSELTATLQYMYHSFILKDQYDDLANLMEKTAIVEMLHIEALSAAIVALGARPVYKTGSYLKPKYWSAEAVDYGKDLCDQLKSDLNSEYLAIRKYREHISRIEDPNIVALLKRIILDEEVHVKLFKAAIEKYCLQK